VKHIFLTILITGGFLFVESHAQTVEETFREAMFFLENGDELQAGKHIRRAVYFAPEDVRFDLWYKAARAGERYKAYKLTESCCDSSVNYLHLGDTSKYKAVLLLKTKALLMLHKNKQALVLLDSNPEYLNPKSDSIAAFYYGIALLETGKIKKAQIAFEQALGSAPEAEKKQLNELFAQPDWFDKPRSETAVRLSQILPGTGQLYAGYPNEAFKSFVLNATLFTVLYDLSVNYSWYNGLLSVYPWFERYYLSGLQKASELAEEKRKLKRQKVINEIIRIVKNE
jgi:tetratricopeptide (TPR) repeat protein